MSASDGRAAPRSRAREHRLHDRFRGPPRASPVRFQVSRPADRTSRGWGREGCLWPNAASQGRPPDGSGGESERSTPNGRAKTFGGGGGGGGGGVVAATPNYLRQASQNLGKYIKSMKTWPGRRPPCSFKQVMICRHGGSRRWGSLARDFHHPGTPALLTSSTHSHPVRHVDRPKLETASASARDPISSRSPPRAEHTQRTAR